MVLGIEGAEFRWAAALAKFQARARHMAAISLHTWPRIQVYGMYANSFLRFVSQVASVPCEVFVAGQAAQAGLVRAPMHALGPWLPPFLSEVGGDAMCMDLRLMADSAAFRLWRAQSDVLRDIEPPTHRQQQHD